MLPKKELNIYPKTSSNIKALLKYYFNDLELNLDGAIEYLIEENTSLKLNQIEYMCKKIFQAYPYVFRNNLNGKISLKNLLSYANQAMTLNEQDWKGSKNRLRITKELKTFILLTELQ